MTQNDQIVNDIAQERLILGTILNRGGAVNDPISDMAEVFGVLKPEHFYSTINSKIYAAMVAVKAEGDTPDISNIIPYAQKHGDIEVENLLDLLQSCDTGDLLRRAMRIRELALRRQLWTLGKKLENAGTSEIGEDIETIIQNTHKTLETIVGEADQQVQTLSDGYGDIYQRIQDCKAAAEHGNTSITGTPTGFSFIDRKGGLQGGDLVIVAGATSMGKTSFATSMVLSSITAGYPVAFYSLEMSRLQLSARIAAMRSGVSSSKMLNRGNELTSQEIIKIDDSKAQLNSDILYISDGSTTSLEKIIVSIRSLHAKKQIKGAVVDYLKLIGMGGAAYRGLSTAEKLAEASRQFKNLAKELDIWIICLSQLNTVDKADPYPTLDNIYGSREIAAAADYVILVYRAEYYNKTYPSESGYASSETHNTALIDIAKGRNTGVGKFLCQFIPEITLFKDFNGQIPVASQQSQYVRSNEEDEYSPF